MASDSNSVLSESNRITAEIYGIRIRKYAKVIIRLLAIILILYAAWNMFAPFLGYESFRVYPTIRPVQATQYKIVYLGDAVGILVGSVVGYIV